MACTIYDWHWTTLACPKSHRWTPDLGEFRAVRRHCFWQQRHRRGRIHRATSWRNTTAPPPRRQRSRPRPGILCGRWCIVLGTDSCCSCTGYRCGTAWRTPAAWNSGRYTSKPCRRVARAERTQQQTTASLPQRKLARTDIAWGRLFTSARVTPTSPRAPAASHAAQIITRI